MFMSLDLIFIAVMCCSSKITVSHICLVNFRLLFKVWSPYASGPIYSLEAIQNSLLRLISIKCKIECLPHTSYKPLLLYLNLDNLQVRRLKQDVCFVYKLLNGYVNYPDLLSNVFSS